MTRRSTSYDCNPFGCSPTERLYFSLFSEPVSSSQLGMLNVVKHGRKDHRAQFHTGHKDLPMLGMELSPGRQGRPQIISVIPKLYVRFHLFLKNGGYREFYKQSTNFTYLLIPLPNVRESWAARRYNGSLCGPFHPNFVQYGVHSFNDLPNFELHVHCNLVIVNTGKELFQIYSMHEMNFERDLLFLQGDKRWVFKDGQER
jgi:hypothetical protein